MAIEWHGPKDGAGFRTTSDFLDCALCDGIIPSTGRPDEIVTCPSCGSEHHAEDLADARVDEIMSRLSERDRLAGRARILREALTTIKGWDPAAAPDEPGGMSIMDAIDIATAALEATKEEA